MNQLPAELLAARTAFSDYLTRYTAQLDDIEPRLREAITYALTGEGKRMRPMLVYAAAAATGSTDGPGAQWLAPALAVELIHTYSLVHDDLPAMDNDDWRRGRATTHRAFDDATAILAGDALQAMAFQLLADPENGLAPASRLACVQRLAEAAGPVGMVGGQSYDLQSNGTIATEQSLSALHRRKTGALIRASVIMGAWSMSPQPEPAELTALDTFADHLGLAFQVVDDILDETGDLATLGKATGSDARAEKTTYLSLLGETDARSRAEGLAAQARAALSPLRGDRSGLDALLELTLTRSN